MRSPQIRFFRRTLVLLSGIALALTWEPAARSQGRAGEPVTPSAEWPGVRTALPDVFLDSLLRSAPGPYDSLLARPQEYETQIIYTRIDRDEHNVPRFTEYTWHVDADRYFNPASLVKLPTAIAALEKVRRYADQGVTPETPMATGVAHRCQTAVRQPFHHDPDRVASVANYVRRMLLVSDNEAYNRLYEFVGQQELNERLTAWKMPTARIVTRFAPGCDSLTNRYTNPITFYPTGRAPVQQAPAFNEQTYPPPPARILKGTAYRKGRVVVNRPFDFTQANRLSLGQITDLLRGVLFPGAGPSITLAPDDRSLLKRYLGLTPHASGFSLYHDKAWFDDYKKYLFYGRDPQRTVGGLSGPRIYNIVGLSYGYVADCAYVVEPASGTEFMLSAVLYVNRDGVLNDGRYEYTSVGWPFLAWLGQAIFNFEQQRPKRNRPDLSEFAE